MNGKLSVCFLALLHCGPVSALSEEGITWQGTYYQAVPVQRYVNQSYCDEHTPGWFVHTVNGALAYPVITNRGIILDQATFRRKTINEFFFLQGEFRARGMSRGKMWEETIHYYLFKRGQLGVTQGIWSTRECKGLYRGIVLKNPDFQVIKKAEARPG